MKKGISPLIATVLIIGFTIVLAALVMQWGSQLFKSTTESTGKTSDLNMRCSSGFNNLKIIEAKAAGNVLKVDNANEEDIAELIVRVGGQGTGGGDTLTVIDAAGIDPYGVKTITLKDSNNVDVVLVANKEVSIVPKILVGTEKLPCPGVEIKATVSA